MELYLACIDQIDALLKSVRLKELEVPDVSWKEAGRNQIIFQEDTAYELGGGNHPSVGLIVYADASDIPDDQVFLAGKDLNELHSDCSYARIAMIGLKEEQCGEGQTLYQNLRKIDYSRYRINPEGFMMQISARKQREQVRISTHALREGLSFAPIGKMFLNAYHQVPCVASVRMIFITDPSFCYASLQKTAAQADGITRALDHLTGTMPTDCSACGLQKICTEVQEMIRRDF